MRKRMAAALLALLALLSLARAEEKPALTVNGQGVSRAECAIYMWNAQNEYAEIARYYSDFLGIDYWSLSYSNGMTVSSMIKADVFQELLMMNVFYQMAQKLNLTLTDAENETCAQNARAYCAEIPVSRADLCALADVEALFKKQLLADQMYSMLLNQTDVDAAAIREAIVPEAYATYEVEYLFRQNVDYDVNGASQSVNDDKAARIESALKEAAAAPSLQNAALGLADLDILYGETQFTAADEGIDPQLKQSAGALALGETSNVIKTDLGWFLIRLKDNTSTAAYEAAVENALYAARAEAFHPTYNDLYASAEYELDTAFWDTLMLSDAPNAR